MWSIGIFDLGLRDEDWRRLTLLEFDSLVRRFNKKKEGDNYQLAALMAHIHNVHRMSDKDPVKKPEDFLPKKKPTKQELSEKIIATFRNMKAN